MIAQQMGDYIRSQIAFYAADVFETLGQKIQQEDIWHDFAEVRTGFIKSTFYVKGLDNVKRKDFNTLSAGVQQRYPELKSFKVKFKRPEKEVRFYIEVNKNNNDV